MESEGWSLDQKTLVSELIQGIEFAKQLNLQLSEISLFEDRDNCFILVQTILCSYEKALLILNWRGSTGQPQIVRILSSAPESPMNASPRSDDSDGVLKDDHAIYNASKKRKTIPRWTEQVRTNLENRLEGPHDDGYSWRKYGQKDILGAKYPRNYYRCTYRNTQNCCAIKQVQRSDEDPTVFEITYHGVHTCSHGQQSAPPQASPEKQQQKESNNSNSRQLQKSRKPLFNIQKGPAINVEDLNIEEMVSPSTPGQNSYPFTPFEMDKFRMVQNLHGSESYFAEITSNRETGLSRVTPTESQTKQAEKKAINSEGSRTPAVVAAVTHQNLVCCDKCQKLRLVPHGKNPSDLPDKWTCSMLCWLPGMNRCSVSEEETAWYELFYDNFLVINSISYPPKPLPQNVNAKYFVQLNLQNVEVELPWTGKQPLVSLTSISLNYSKLSRIPDLSKAQRLAKLDLQYCMKLVEISSIQSLSNLDYLNLKGCRNLKSLPSMLDLSSLSILILTGCASLVQLPELSRSTKQLHLSASAIEELPSTIGCLTGLTKLDLRNCTRLKSLPPSICNLTSLETLNVSGCVGLRKSSKRNRKRNPLA